MVMRRVVKISEQSKVIVYYDNGWYTAKHYRNGCNKSLEVKQSTSIDEINVFIKKLREVFNGSS